MRTQRIRTGTVRSTGRLLAGLLACAALAGCGTERADAGATGAARPSPVRTTAPPTNCGASGTTDETTDETTDDGAGTPGPPTDEDTGTPGPPTDEDTGTPGPPTDQDTGTPGPPTDQDTGTPGPPTDGQVTDGAGPCGEAGWFGMTKDFLAYYTAHATKADDGQLGSVTDVRVRIAGKADMAVAVVTTDFRPEATYAADRVAEVFATWRTEVYGDHGTVSVVTREGGRLSTKDW
ncbi:hypothetical protein AB0G73_34980 [Streptomyces sp. NPDC020719]|uniref:hypothetical protein n=1 Tax=Streptomyces sp. NPDC020719 TaxID=3154896 RepID=UPI0034101D8A